MKLLDNSKRIIIKIGSSLMANEEEKHHAWLDSLADDIAAITKKHEIIIVSSGAVALGRRVLKFDKKILQLHEKQAAAAAGQGLLMQLYRESFKKHNIATAQILLTLEDSENRRRYLNARNTLETLFEHNVVPVINENDTVATSELRFGDNDRMAAIVAQMVNADLLILFSDVDGLYNMNPKQHKDAKHIDEVHEITEDVEKMAGGTGSYISSGGMITKIAAAKIAVSSGCHTVVADGTLKNPLKHLLDGGKHTKFISKETPLGARKRWILNSLNIKGSVVIDQGAVIALYEGKSLLPAGIREVKGVFEEGDTISILDSEGKEIARGITHFSKDEAIKIIGKPSKQFELILGYPARDELIHRNDLVVI